MLLKERVWLTVGVIFHLFFAGWKNEEGDDKDQAYKPCPVSVEPFPEKDSFIVIQCKMSIDHFELCNFFILIETRLPGCVIHRRKTSQ